MSLRIQNKREKRKENRAILAEKLAKKRGTSTRGPTSTGAPVQKAGTERVKARRGE